VDDYCTTNSAECFRFGKESPSD